MIYIEGIVTVKVKQGTLFQAHIWQIICLLASKKNYILIDDIIEINIDGEVIPKPENMEDDT